MVAAVCTMHDRIGRPTSEWYDCDVGVARHGGPCAVRACLPGIEPVSLRTLFPRAELIGAEDIRVTSCTCDSRRCRPGDVFVATRGSQVDGHQFASEAAASGAVAILSQRPLPQVALPNCIVPDSREAYGLLCQALAGNPSHRLRTVGITGTNGKTTTSFLTASVLEAAGCSPGVMGTLGYFDGLDVKPATLTTPPTPVLARWLGRMEANDCTHAVLEVSSHALCQSRVAGITFDVACVTNVRHDHLDYHQTPERYLAAKAKLLDHLSPEGFVVLNADDPACDYFADRVSGPSLTIGIEKAAEISATPVETFTSEQTFLLTHGEETVPVRTCLIGRHNIYNCLMAAAVGFGYGIELSTIVRGLESVRKIPGRLERIECGQPFSVFVDYAHTPDALAGCLQTLRGLAPGRLVCVFGAGGERDQQKRPLMARAVEVDADLAVVTSDNPRGEHPEVIIDDILVGFRNRADVRVIPDRAEAIHWALAQARQGDCVLIAGKGHEHYQIVGAGRLPFDDRVVARQFLYSESGQSELPRAA